MKIPAARLPGLKAEVEAKIESSQRAAELRGAISSVAAEHADDCECMVCLAEAGDEDALVAVEVAAALGRLEVVDDA